MKERSKSGQNRATKYNFYTYPKLSTVFFFIYESFYTFLVTYLYKVYQLPYC